MQEVKETGLAKRIRTRRRVRRKEGGKGGGTSKQRGRGGGGSGCPLPPYHEGLGCLKAPRGDLLASGLMGITTALFISRLSRPHDRQPRSLEMPTEPGQFGPCVPPAHKGGYSVLSPSAGATSRSVHVKCQVVCPTFMSGVDLDIREASRLIYRLLSAYFRRGVGIA